MRNANVISDVNSKKNKPKPDTDQIIAAAIRDEGYVSIRMAVQIRDTTKKQYVGMPGEAIGFKAPNKKALDLALNRVVAALQQGLKKS